MIPDPSSAADATAVYRMFDQEGHLLYVGQTTNPGLRVRQHAEKRWFLQVKTITLDWYPTVADAATAERAAIWNEDPRYNRRRDPIAPSKPTPPARPPDPAAIRLYEKLTRTPCDCEDYGGVLIRCDYHEQAKAARRAARRA